MKDIRLLTPLRGLAALSIVLFHLIGSTLTDLNALLTQHSSYVSKSYLWVDLFFLLSGFVITHVYAADFQTRLNLAAAKRFLRNRFARLYPLHLFSLLMFVGLEIWVLSPTNPFGSPERSLSALLNNVLLLQAFNLHPYLTWNPPAWSISAEFYVYLLFPLLALLLHRFSTLALVGLLGLAPLALYGLVDNDYRLDLTYNFGVLRCLVEFSIGMVLYRLFVAYPLAAARRSSALFISIICLPLLALHLGWHDPLIVLCFAALLWIAADNASRAAVLLDNPVTQRLGEISYSIYLLHVPVYYSLSALLTQLFALPIAGPGLSVGFSLWICLGVCVSVVLTAELSYRWVEVPARRYLRARWHD